MSPRCGLGRTASRNKRLQLRCTSCGVPDSCDLHNPFLRLDSVDNPTWFANDLADAGIVEFGDSPAGFGKVGQVLNRMEYVLDETGSYGRTDSAMYETSSLRSRRAEGAQISL